MAKKKNKVVINKKDDLKDFKIKACKSILWIQGNLDILDADFLKVWKNRWIEFTLKSNKNIDELIKVDWFYWQWKNWKNFYIQYMLPWNSRFVKDINVMATKSIKVSELLKWIM